MALIPTRITNLVWDTARGVVTVNVLADDAPPRPNDGANYSQPIGSQLSFDVPVRRAATDPPTITKIQTSPSGFVLTRYTWSGTAWANPLRVDENGNPI